MIEHKFKPSVDPELALCHIAFFLGVSPATVVNRLNSKKLLGRKASEVVAYLQEYGYGYKIPVKSQIV